jgi:hypothetical protein
VYLLLQILCSLAYLEVLYVTFKLCCRMLLTTCAAAKCPSCSWAVVNECKSTRACICSTLLTAAKAFAAYLCADIPQTSARCPRAAQYVEHGTCNCSGASVTKNKVTMADPHNTDKCDCSTAFLGRYGSELWTYRVSDEALQSSDWLCLAPIK